MVKGGSRSLSKLNSPVAMESVPLNGDTLTDKEKANLLNSTFQSHFINETSKNIPPLIISHLIPDMPLIRVSEGSVKTMLLKVDTSKASGPDGITPKVLKSCAEVLSPSIVALFNKSLSRGEIPDAWRESIVIPIHKKSDPKNYRPVSLTSSVCKLLENIVRQHLQTHLNKHNLLIDNQHGFRSKRSCETKLISTLNDWCKALGNKQNIEIIYLDISHAFDCVPYNRLLTKLYNIGIKGNLLGWFCSFLTTVIPNGSQ